jgi:5-methylcytosine-specific restriction endonuclease McrA
MSNDIIVMERKCEICSKSLITRQKRYCSNICKNRTNKGNTKYTADEIRDIICKYNSGMSTVKIAKEYSIDPKGINGVLSRNGVERRKPSYYVGRRTKRKSRPKDTDKMIQMYNDGKTLNEIGIGLGFCQSVIYECLKGHVEFRQGSSGERNPNFGKRGKECAGYKEPHLRKTPLYMAIRGCIKYSEWRSKVYKRDNYTCIICGDNKGGNLNADHIISFAVILEKHHMSSLEDALICDELWDVDNGRTLCVECHKKTDTWGHKTRMELREKKDESSND